ncbi:hypothetical protein [Brevundimonas goettingensis]|uniref:Uncharacterized protein n=1 Tax=Brevundimonas goettingensis TaxID=2774190 RepID=A0A975C4V1_9CAUL|nr:hypothetical protein [Brevundimonas goettingensis]QTC91582.1 hypothetical protein IFJ75_01185 [Brevundimonas goettingensis]
MTPAVIMAVAGLQVSPATASDLPSMAVDAVFSVCVPVIENTLSPADPEAFDPQPAEEIERQRNSFGPDDRQAFRYASPTRYVGIALQPAFTVCATSVFTDARAVHAAVRARLDADGWKPISDAPDDGFSHWWERPGSSLVISLHYSDTEADNTGFEAQVMDRNKGSGAAALAAFAYQRRSFAEALVSAATEVCPLSLANAEPTPAQQAFLEQSTTWNEAYLVHSREGEVYVQNGEDVCLVTAQGPEIAEAETALRQGVAATSLKADIVRLPTGLRALIRVR